MEKMVVLQGGVICAEGATIVTMIVKLHELVKVQS